TQQRAKLQDALDAAALYAAKSSATTDADLDAAGEKSLKANLQLIKGATLIGADFHGDGTKVVASASVKLPAYAPTLYAHQPVEVGSQVERAMDDLEVALVLDNTGSMAQNHKIETLRTEATKLVGKLEAAAARSDHKDTAVKIALVPFSFAVRPVAAVNLTNYNASNPAAAGVPAWIDPQGKNHLQAATPTYKYDICSTMTDRLAIMSKLKGNTWAGCVEARAQPYDVTDDAPVAGAAATWFVPYFWPDEPDNPTTSGYANDYLTDAGGSDWTAIERNVAKYANGANGFKNSRETKTFKAAGGDYSYGPNAGCALQPVIRLTNNMKSITDAIAKMDAIGTTNIPQGLAWGWHSLSPNLPFQDGRAYETKHLRKVIILMTDGENTFLDAKTSANLNQSDYTGLGYIWQKMLGITDTDPFDDRTKKMDERVALLCKNAKDKKIEIYTILVEESSTASSTLLSNCASSPSKFYNVQNVATLGVAFDAIAGSITNMRLSH
ncbi:MAG: hypothetical protein ACREEG_02625, partial [Phenylobacterium sp.]